MARPAHTDQAAEDDDETSVVRAFPRVGPPQLVRDQALETVKSAIISGRLKPGTRLKDRALCEALGVSRTIVRDVIRELATEKLVEITAHRGPRVAILTPKMAREIYDMRAELEVMLVRAFITHAPPGSAAPLWPLMEEVEAAAAARDIPALVAIMQRLYTHLLEGADNAVLADTLLSLLARISWLRVTSMTEPGRIERSVTEIRRIVERIDAADASGAERAVRAYVTAARDAALRQLSTNADTRND